MFRQFAHCIRNYLHNCTFGAKLSFLFVPRIKSMKMRCILATHQCEFVFEFFNICLADRKLWHSCDIPPNNENFEIDF